MICNECENDAFDLEDGFFYCQRCGVQAEGIIRTVIVIDEDDFINENFINEVAWSIPTINAWRSRPASRWTVEMLPNITVLMVEKGECVICLEEWSKGDMETELPCKHKYHLKCVKKWLEIHSTCPQCRYELMPLEGEVGVSV
ncbi:unnamed protein product, partial [Arabidopsis halleri]